MEAGAVAVVLVVVGLVILLVVALRALSAARRYRRVAAEVQRATAERAGAIPAVRRR